jgi:hypothetical protein
MQIHSPYFNSAPICTHVGMAYIARLSQWGGGVHFTCSNDFYLSLLRVKEGGGSQHPLHPPHRFASRSRPFLLCEFSLRVRNLRILRVSTGSKPPSPHPHDNIYLLSFFLLVLYMESIFSLSASSGVYRWFGLLSSYYTTLEVFTQFMYRAVFQLTTVGTVRN